MGQGGASTARDGRRSRAWVDFGVDESWEPAPRRRRLEPVAAERPRPEPVAAERSRREPVAAERSRREPVAAERFRREPVAAERPRPEPVGAQRPRAAAAAAVAVREDPFPAAYEPDPADYAAIERLGHATPGAPGGVSGRRTVTIRGRGAERELAFPTYRSADRPATPRRERPGYKPDRTAMWAVLLGVLLVLVAATSSHAAVLTHHAPARHPALTAPARGHALAARSFSAHR